MARKRTTEQQGDESRRVNRSRDGFGILTNRTSLSILVDSISKLNESQIKAVKDIGMGHILGLTVNKVPRKLAYYVLSNFNEQSCEIILDEGRRIRLEEEDVYCTIGLPRGKLDFVTENVCFDQDLVQEWRSITAASKPKSISASNVKDSMLSLEDGCDWFKRQFLILVMTSLIETSSTGYISQKFLSNFTDLTKVADLNWCKYTIQVLIEQKMKWTSNTSNPFLGPILILVDFYIDRVVIGLRTVPRMFPTIVAWTKQLVRKRQESEIQFGKFGTGYPTDRFLPIIESNNETVVSKGITELSVDDPAKIHAMKFCKVSEKLSQSLTEFLTVLQEGSNTFFGYFETYVWDYFNHYSIKTQFLN